VAANVYAGTLAYVELPGGGYTFDSWTLDLSCETADVSDYRRTAARFLGGLPVASISLSGPYSRNTSNTPQGLGMVPRFEYAITLGLSPFIGILVTVLVRSVRVTHTVRGVARTEVTGVVNDDFLSNPVVIDL